MPRSKDSPDFNRTNSVRIKLTPDMEKRAEACAKALGLPLATYCAMAIGQQVRANETQNGSIEKIGEILADRVGQTLEGFMESAREIAAREAKTKVDAIDAAVDLGEARK